ncbi:MAG TPA: stage II sporulation protein M [Opitutaceae bacterium]|nr:stage II sporulation protein M [Opitutaceae bacterium]
MEKSAQISRNGRIIRALHRTRTATLSVAAVNLLAVLVGIGMAHSGSALALRYRDKIVAKALQQDPAAVSNRQGHKLAAAGKDFSRNLLIGAVPMTVTGLTIVSPYGFSAFRGWVGGIVSVDHNHESRFRTWRKAVYFIVTLILQLIPYSLAGGAGVQLGWSYFRPGDYRGGEKIGGYPKEALRDVVRVYALIIPLFLIASLWEFLCPWN